MNLSKLLLAAAVGCASLVSAKSHPSCLDDNGKPVDHWHILKAPTGNETYVFDGKGEMKKSKYGMGGDNGAVPETILQIYDKFPKEHAFLMWNDETDDEKSAASHAHSKGLLLFDDKQGFWLIHSLPRYPSQTDKGYDGLPDNRYGQSFLCMNFATEDLDDIANQLMVMWPQFYDSSFSKGMEKKYPVAASLPDKVKSKDATSTLNIQTIGGKNFTHFAKGKTCDCETYEDVIAPGLDSDLQVETWMNGAIKNKIPTTCKGKKSPYTIEDVSELETADGTSWTETRDHSKWAITKGKKTFTCFGDTNRQVSQAKRGGGSMCHNDKKLHKAISSMVQEISNPCK